MYTQTMDQSVRYCYNVLGLTEGLIFTPNLKIIYQTKGL